MLISIGIGIGIAIAIAVIFVIFGVVILQIGDLSESTMPLNESSVWHDIQTTAKPSWVIIALLSFIMGGVAGMMRYYRGREGGM